MPQIFEQSLFLFSLLSPSFFSRSSLAQSGKRKKLDKILKYCKKVYFSSNNNVAKRALPLLPKTVFMFSGRDRSNRGRREGGIVRNSNRGRRAGGIVRIEGGQVVRIGLRDEVVADFDLMGDPAAAAAGCVTRKNGVCKESSTFI